MCVHSLHMMLKMALPGETLEAFLLRRGPGGGPPIVPWESQVFRIEAAPAWPRLYAPPAVAVKYYPLRLFAPPPASLPVYPSPDLCFPIRVRPFGVVPPDPSSLPNPYSMFWRSWTHLAPQKVKSCWLPVYPHWALELGNRSICGYRHPPGWAAR